MNTLEMIRTNEFWQENRTFFDAGVLRIVYAAENFCVCNMCESAYITFDLVRIAPQETRYGLRTTVNQFKSMADDEDYYLRWLEHLYEKGTWQKRLVALDQPTLSWMISMKQFTDAEGPGAHVDVKFEEKLQRRRGKG